MSLIDDIRKDRDRPQVREKSAPIWATLTDNKSHGWVDVVGPSIKVGAPTTATNLNGADYVARHADARRIARVPQMEAALLAAEELVSAAMTLCIKANKPMKAGRKWATYDVDVMTDAVSHYKFAHAAYRAATGAA